MEIEDIITIYGDTQEDIIKWFRKIFHLSINKFNTHKEFYQNSQS